MKKIRKQNIIFSLLATTIVFAPIKYYKPNILNDKENIINYNKKDLIEETKIEYETLNKYIVSNQSEKYLELDLFNLAQDEFNMDMTKEHLFVREVNVELSAIEHFPAYTYVDHSHDKPHQSGYGTDHSGDVTVHVPARDQDINFGKGDFNIFQGERILKLTPTKNEPSPYDNIKFESGYISLALTKFIPNENFEDEWHKDNWDGEHTKDDLIKDWSHTIDLSNDGKREVKKVTFKKGSEFDPYRNIYFDTIYPHHYNNPAFTIARDKKGHEQMMIYEVAQQA